MSIADPITPSRVAHVDSSGRLTTVGASSTLDMSGFFRETDLNAISAPTTASLAITSLSLSNPSYNSSFSNTEFTVTLDQASSSSSTSCIPAGGSALARYFLAPGDDLNYPFPEPLILKATGTTPYCLVLVMIPTDEGDATIYSSPAYQMTAYVNSGTYTGVGVAGETSATTPAKQTERSGR